jgi:hypothetical protein
MKQMKRQSEHVVHFHLNPMLTSLKGLKVGEWPNVYGGFCHHVPTLILKTLVMDPWSCEYSHD